MPELSFNEIMKVREITRAREIYARQDIVQREKQADEEFISERKDVKMHVLKLQKAYYSRYLENEKPKIDVVA